MPGYVLVRTVDKIFEKEIEAAAGRSTGILEGIPGVRWILSYYSAEEGKMYCGYEAPNVELAPEPAQRLEIAMFR